MSAEKNDCFVGNLAFSVTEEQLLEHFSIVGPVKKVRLLYDKDNNRPKGFAFVEYFDPLIALAAIRHLNNTELGGKQLRVGFASNSTLREKAKELGQDIPDSNASSATQSVANGLALHEAWDILEAMKQLIDEDRSAAKVLLENYPQLVFALHEIQRRLGVVSNIPSHSVPNNTQTIQNNNPMVIPVPEFITVPDLLGESNNQYNTYYNDPSNTMQYDQNQYSNIQYGNTEYGNTEYGNNGIEYENTMYDNSHYVPPPLPPNFDPNNVNAYYTTNSSMSVPNPQQVQFNDPPDYNWG